MNQISSITELMALSGCQYRVFDLGRKITKLSKSSFEKMENNQCLYPFPVQSHAMLAIAFWHSSPIEPYLWFVKLPIDEQGFLIQAARNHFIGIIIEALGSDLTTDPSKRQQELLKNNPYHFTPAQYKLASLNAILKASFKQPASNQYEHCQLYLSGKLGWESWQGVGIQGLCDFAARIEQEENTALLINALPHLPMQVLSPLASALENQELTPKLITSVLGCLQQYMLAENQKAELLLRMLASSCEQTQVKKEIQPLLSREQAISAEILITLTSRCWPVLDNEDVVLKFLEQLAIATDIKQFIAIFSDIIALPDLRPILLSCIRNPNRSEQLSQKIGALFSQVKA